MVNPRANVIVVYSVKYQNQQFQKHIKAVGKS